MKKFLLLVTAVFSLGLSSCERVIDDIIYYTAEYLYMEYIGGYPNFYYRAGPAARFDGRVYEWGNMLYFTTNSDFAVSVRLERYEYHTQIAYGIPGYAVPAPYPTRISFGGRTLTCDYYGERIVIHLNDY